VQEYDGENNANISENGELRLMRERLPAAATVFDVGANVGAWSRHALDINPRISLHCFEPSAATFAKLVQNGFPANVICNRFGLSSSRREGVLLVFSEGSTLNSIYRREGLEDSLNLAPQSRTEPIELRTLDDYCSEKQISTIDFLKVDVEGHELECFRGATGLLSRKGIDLIQFEYGGCNVDARVFLKDIFGFFADFPGYHFCKILPDSLRPANRYDQHLDNFQYQNWVIALD
jgi:FkbM family methyltransferase